MSDHRWENRWAVYKGVLNLKPDADGSVTISFDTPADYYLVSDLYGNDRGKAEWYEVKLTGKNAERRAQNLADEFNRYEWQGPLDPAFAERRKRLKRLAPDFNRYHEGPSEARFPVRPARYLIHDYGVGWHPEDFYDLVDDLSQVEAAIAGDEANVGRVIDLDTGKEVAFTREVVVEVPA